VVAVRTIALTLHFHTASRIATGRAARGLDAVLDHERIPASSLKGLMRAAAVEILALPPSRVAAVYGSAGQGSPWAWNDIALPSGDGKRITTRVRIPIDPVTGVAREGGMFHAEELWLQDPVTCTVDQTRMVPDADDQALVLAASAMAVKGIGASRRRGLGWTTWSAVIDGRSVPPSELASAVLRLREG
jgi:hypothetical protein